MPLAAKDKRQDIIAATIRLISDYGFHGTPISMIAREAGVGAGTIYRYFKDKDSLFLETFQQVDGAFKRALLEEYEDGRPTRDRFLHLCRGVYLYGVKHPAEFKFIEQFYHSPYGTDLRREKLFCACGDAGQEHPFKQVFEGGQQQGVIKYLPLVSLLALSIGPVVFLVKDTIAGLICLDEAMINQTLVACWDAVKCPGVA